ncbi:MAG: undecaprenyl/decaprenyl-phosphate alpha-N-acetylglucosaminyl 1-phosphate transferase [Bacteroidia bacterium]|nr:undecaprenyl/decaprenyl-phosphate alpha-N-acetylglucosaminyl 1-phosphate transferase [Bacteroidia bacterium]MCZ2276488.1 undecaprenyl/decaprenyl-phosphate alpha-N-acetylglucosaminyl 1-phosphate transferase [Bacteroidia bacterium]
MKDIIVILLPFISSLFIAILITRLWIKSGTKWHLFEKPDERKHHIFSTPNMGGIGILAALVIPFFILGGVADFTQTRFIMASTFIMFFTGFFDDLLNLTPSKKFFMQLIAAFIVCLNGMVLHNLHGLFGIHILAEPYATAITTIIIVLFINAFNFIDGVDGLAGSIGSVSSLIFGILFFKSGQGEMALLSFCLCGALLGFLYFNRYPARIFMGDTGSLFVGFLLIVSGIQVINQGVVQHPDNESSIMAFVFAILFIPVYDLIRVVTIRLVTGQSPLKPDRNHLHHMIGRQNFGHSGITFIILVFNLSLIFLQQQMRFVSINYFIVISILTAMLTMNTYVVARISVLRDKFLGTDNRFSHLSDH